MYVGGGGTCERPGWSYGGKMDFRSEPRRGVWQGLRKSWGKVFDTYIGREDRGHRRKIFGVAGSNGSEPGRKILTKDRGEKTAARAGARGPRGCLRRRSAKKEVVTGSKKRIQEFSSYPNWEKVHLLRRRLRPKKIQGEPGNQKKNIHQEPFRGGGGWWPY